MSALRLGAGTGLPEGSLPGENLGVSPGAAGPEARQSLGYRPCTISWDINNLAILNIGS
jgi:hypothetical protein